MTKDIFLPIFKNNFEKLDNTDKADILTGICENICKELGVSNYPKVTIESSYSSGGALEGEITISADLIDKVSNYHKIFYKEPYIREHLCAVLVHECVHQLQFQNKEKYGQFLSSPASNSSIYLFQNTEIEAYLKSLRLINSLSDKFSKYAKIEHESLVDQQISIINNLSVRGFIDKIDIDKNLVMSDFSLPSLYFTPEQSENFNKFFNEYYKTDIVNRNNMTDIFTHTPNYCKNFEKLCVDDVNLFNVELDNCSYCILEKDNVSLSCKIENNKLSVFNINVKNSSNDPFCELENEEMENFNILMAKVNNLRTFYNVKNVEISDFVFNLKNDEERQKFKFACDILSAKIKSKEQIKFEDKFLNSKIMSGIYNVICFPSDKNYKTLISNCNEYIAFYKENHLPSYKINKTIFLRDNLCKPNKRLELASFIDNKYHLKKYLLNKDQKPNFIDDFNIKKISCLKGKHIKVQSVTELEDIINLYSKKSLNDIASNKLEPLIAASR